ncbi:MAG: PepSY domain-containing protein [Actinomycetota bacterium]
MNRRTKLIVGAAIAVAAISGGTGVGLATLSGSDTPLTGSALEKATQAALEHTGGGTVLETETGDEGAAYGVEIRKPDGSVVEVQLDQNFNVMGDTPDDDGPNDTDGPGDDEGSGS